MGAQRPKASARRTEPRLVGPADRDRVLNARRHRLGEQSLRLSPTRPIRSACSTPEGIGSENRSVVPHAGGVRRRGVLNARRHRLGEQEGLKAVQAVYPGCSTPEGIGSENSARPPSHTIPTTYNREITDRTSAARSPTDGRHHHRHNMLICFKVFRFTHHSVFNQAIAPVISPTSRRPQWRRSRHRPVLDRRCYQRFERPGDAPAIRRHDFD